LGTGTFGAPQDLGVLALLFLPDQRAELALHPAEVAPLDGLTLCNRTAIRLDPPDRQQHRPPCCSQPALRRGELLLGPLPRVDRFPVDTNRGVDVMAAKVEIGTVAPGDVLDDGHLPAMNVGVDCPRRQAPSGGCERLPGRPQSILGRKDLRIGVLLVGAGEAQRPVGRRDAFCLRVDLLPDAPGFRPLVSDGAGRGRRGERRCESYGGPEEDGEPPGRLEAGGGSHGVRCHPTGAKNSRLNA
jgi:hypothetical protein